MVKEHALIKAHHYADLVRENLEPKKIILYGSSAKDDWSGTSDIDIAVIVKTVEGDFLDIERLLFRLRRNIDDRIEPVLLEEENDRSGFIQGVIDTGYLLYSS
jgi:uncharacterized protein